MTSHIEMAREALASVGYGADSLTAIKIGENAIIRAGHIVARIARPGQLAAARKEVAVSRWLATVGIHAVRPLDVVQPIEVAGHPVTLWEELPPHRKATAPEVASTLRELHRLAIPGDHLLQPVTPFVRLQERIEAATTLRDDERAWLVDHLAILREQHRDLPPGLPLSVLHGDAHNGNMAVTNDGLVYLLDLERFAIGPPEWDLMLTAVEHTSTGWFSSDDYAEFCQRYGHDVTTWPGFTTLRDIREMRMTLFVAQLAAEHPDARDEAALRVACLRGRNGPRPWSWTPM